MQRLAAAIALAAACAAAQAADYVNLPGGRFESVLPQGAVPGASEPVDVAPFALRETPVTVAEFAAFVHTHPQWRRDRVPVLFAERRYLVDWDAPLAPRAPAASPVVNVSWHAARAYCAAEGARLPTWLEWEYAAAASETKRDATDDAAFLKRLLSLYPVKGKSFRNVYGVYGLHGIIWEWTQDFSRPAMANCAGAAMDASNAANYPAFLREAFRASLTARSTTSTLGFRCAL